ncbi:MAG: HTTM domain-containing protein [Bacteroidota bacterium]
MSSTAPSLWSRILHRPESSAPLGIFRIVFGILVAGELAWYSLARPFMEVFYFDAQLHFGYPGWPPLPFFSGSAMQIYVAGLALAYLLLAAGAYYRIVRWVCCLGFGYLFFLERAAFLNHWYLTLLISGLLLVIPAHVRFSLDIRREPSLHRVSVPAWMRGSLLLLVALVYFMSGLAKLNPDWLSGRTMDLVLQTMAGGIERAPDPGSTAIAGAWGIALLELIAAPALFIRPLRRPAILLLTAFHLANLFFFTIGFFPILMIALTFLFWPRPQKTIPQPSTPAVPTGKFRTARYLLIPFFLLQIWLPLRHYRHDYNTLWTEDERLFTWDMFLAFKGGQAHFRVRDKINGRDLPVRPEESELTWGQQNKIFKSPDMILQYAHYLERRYTREGGTPAVFAEVQNGLNGRPEQAFVPPNLDLARQKRRLWTSYPWVLPLQAPPP